MKEDVILFQEISANAWPAMNFIFINGWVVRVGDGYTRRANSVMPIKYFGHDIDSDIGVIEDLYSSIGLPSIFQIPDFCDPHDLMAILLSKGYEEFDESLVMSQDIAKLNSITINSDFIYEIVEDSSEEWFQHFQKITNRSDDIKQKNQAIINRIPFKKGFIHARNSDGEIVGLCLGVIERKYIGIYDMIVSSDFRRLGLGQSILAKLVEWGTHYDATTCYLQVQGDNSGAISLYTKLGLVKRYNYRYLIKNK